MYMVKANLFIEENFNLEVLKDSVLKEKDYVDEGEYFYVMDIINGGSGHQLEEISSFFGGIEIDEDDYIGDLDFVKEVKEALDNMMSGLLDEDYEFIFDNLESDGSFGIFSRLNK